MGAAGREQMNRAFEAVERVALALRDDFERLVVIVSANFAACHRGVSFNLGTGGRRQRPSCWLNSKRSFEPVENYNATLDAVQLSYRRTYPTAAAVLQSRPWATTAVRDAG